MNKLTKIRHLLVDALAEIDKIEAPKVDDNETKPFGKYFISRSGKVFRPSPAGYVEYDPLQMKSGHLYLKVGSKTVYLAKVVYCLFSGFDYWTFTGRVRFADGNKSNCSYENIIRK